MRVHTSLSASITPDSYAVTVGTFDGVHCGHQTLVETLRREAAQRGLRTAVLTFTDMPYCYFKPDDCPCLLTLTPEKIEAFRALQIDDLWIIPFNEKIARQSAEEFVKTALIRQLGMKLLVAGPDFALGKAREGDISTLRGLGTQYDFEVSVLGEKLMVDNAPISSTRVRGCVEASDVSAATRMLGHPFSFSGEVISGKQLGRTIGVPTINVQVAPRKVIPAKGVYAARAIFDDDTTIHKVALSIGNNPTVGGSTLSIEFHVIDEDIPQPPRMVRLEVIEWLRGEQKFPDIDTLVQQMQRDIVLADSILRT